ncbi:MAG: YoaK family protein, partial [Oscillospiraceae bacterium]
MNQSQKSRQMSETFQLGILLAGIGGFLDAYTYICRGGVFANAQTGNIVLLGMRLAERNPMAAVRYVIPILAFVAGVVVAEWIKNKYKNTAKIHWRQIIILIECLVLLGVAFLPQTNESNLLANVMISFV